MPLNTRTRWNMGEVRDLREAAGLGIVANLANVSAVVERCQGDFDLALQALMMRPKPEWVRRLLAGENLDGES